MRIGYCSPFNPIKSGISDFSEELIQVLGRQIEIVIFAPVLPDNAEISGHFEAHLITDLDNAKLRESLDLIVYHMGNHAGHHGAFVKMMEKYPGVLELHDFSLHNLVAQLLYVGKGPEAYLEEARYCHGNYGVKIAQSFLDGMGGVPWETHALDMCMNKRFIEQARAVIVHSDMAKQMILARFPSIPITTILLHSDVENEPTRFQRQCRAQLGIPENILVFGSFGFATTAKRILSALQAVKKFSETYHARFLYVIVGEAQKELGLPQKIKEYGLSDCVKITGFTDLDDFKTYMGACDFGLNLRYPTQGESSASLHRMMGMAKPVIVTDVGTFSEYPDDIAIKVGYGENETDEIYQAICTLAKDKAELGRRGKLALEYARQHCNIDKNAEKYARFFREVVSGTWQPEYEDLFITRLLDLGLTGEQELKHYFEILNMKNTPKE